jgi:hypothetical protein
MDLINTLLPVFLIGILFASPAALTNLRIYFRTRMKSFFCTGVGAAISTIGFGGLFFCGIVNLSIAWGYIVFFALVLLGLVFDLVGSVILWTKESGLWKEIGETTSFWQRLTGNVPMIKYNKLPSPSLKRRTGIIIGIILITLGIIWGAFLKLTLNYFSVIALSMSIMGLLLVIFSTLYLSSGER